MRQFEKSGFDLLGTFLVTLALLGGPAIAQPPSSQLPQELIVLLAPSPPGPDPEEVVHAVNNGRAVPGGLGEGNPTSGRLLAERAHGWGWTPSVDLAQALAEVDAGLRA